MAILPFLLRSRYCGMRPEVRALHEKFVRQVSDAGDAAETAKAVAVTVQPAAYRNAQSAACPSQPMVTVVLW